jgi:ubiquinone/menaquinone biosynthesis C-methylase UbiE
MVPYNVEALAWQESWDRQQEAYLPDREERFTALLDTVDAVTNGHPQTILDLAGGTGSISLRALHRFPKATTTLVDVDPVLLSIARASLDERTAIVTADLRTPDWVTALPHHDYDAVLTATALHWLQPDRLAALYAEIRQVLRPGGVFINADHMPDEGLPTLNEKLGDRERTRRDARYASGAVLSWEAWWDHVAKDPTLGPLVEQRRQVFTGGHAAEFDGPLSWHLDALRAAGFSEVGTVWRGARDAAVTGLR